MAAQSSSNSYTPHSHIPFGADGSGFYSDNTIGCYNVIQAATSITLNVIDLIPYKKDEAFVICDYGTADGGTSMFLMNESIDHIEKKYGKDSQIHIVYEDQPVNDFKSLFLRINGLIPGPPSYLKDRSNVFVSAVGTSFYSQCVPDKSVHLGFSATAMHWLTQRPCDITEALHHTAIEVKEEKEKFQAQAAEDWECNLLHRAKELKSGGRMVIVCFAIDKDGQYLGNTKAVLRSMYHTMTKMWKRFVEDGKITQEEFQKTTFNNYYRTEEEFAEPFKAPNSPVVKAGLKLVEIQMKSVSCPYREKWLKDGKKDDTEAAKAHARWFIPTTRTWSNSTFLSALNESRSQSEKEALVDEFFQSYENEVAASPSDHGMDYVHAYIHIAKE